MANELARRHSSGVVAVADDHKAARGDGVRGPVLDRSNYAILLIWGQIGESILDSLCVARPGARSFSDDFFVILIFHA